MQASTVPQVHERIALPPIGTCFAARLYAVLVDDINPELVKEFASMKSPKQIATKKVVCDE